MNSSRRLRALLLSVLIGGNVLVIALSAYSLRHSRQHSEQRAVTQTQNIAVAIDQSIANSIGKIDFALKAIADELAKHSTELIPNAPALNRFMARHAQRLPEIESLRAINEMGTVVLGNDVDLSKPVSVADRRYFVHLRSHQDDQLFITEPLLGRISGNYFVLFARRFNHPDGKFAGLVVTTIPLNFFTRLIANFDIGPQGAIALRDNKMSLITRLPSLTNLPTGQIGNQIISYDLQQALNSGAQNSTFHTITPSDGVERIVSARRLESSQMYAVVGLATVDYQAEWRTELYKTSTIVLIFVLLSTLAAVALLRLIRQADIREGHIRELAFYDPLTGLPSLRLGEDRLDMTLNQARRQGLMAGVLFMDLDRFKDVNDLYGHEAGDYVLQTVAIRLTQIIRAVDTVARIGGDEFLVIFGTIHDRSVAADVAQKIVTAVHEPIVFRDTVLSIGCSIGISLFPDDAPDAQGLRRCADTAMYHVKRSGKNAFAFFESTFPDSVFSKLQHG